MPQTERFKKLIAEVSEWSQNNFGGQKSKWEGQQVVERTPEGQPVRSMYHFPIILDHVAPLLGIIEEFGELASAVAEERYDLVKDSVADIMIYLADYMARTGINSNVSWYWIEDRLKIETDLTHHHSHPEKVSERALIHLGKFVHANLKRHQGIRGWDDGNKFVAFASHEIDELILLTGRLLAHGKKAWLIKEGLGLNLVKVTLDEILTITETEWANVKLRNWKTQPKTGS